MTFPHRKFYFANDDRMVGHYRRYELGDILKLLDEEGMEEKKTRKVLGPLEKLIMIAATFAIKLLSFQKKNNERWLFILSPIINGVNKVLYIFAWLDARISPLSLASVILIKAKKNC